MNGKLSYRDQLMLLVAAFFFQVPQFPDGFFLLGKEKEVCGGLHGWILVRGWWNQDLVVVVVVANLLPLRLTKCEHPQDTEWN